VADSSKVNRGTRRFAAVPSEIPHIFILVPLGTQVALSSLLAVSYKEIFMTTALVSTFLAQTAAFPMGLVSLAVTFFIIAIIAYVLGARGVAGMSAGIGRTLLFVFLILAVVVIIFGMVPRA
jgi:uncharacterized membrane protein YtjA (UPF0391 family)